MGKQVTDTLLKPDMLSVLSAPTVSRGDVAEPQFDGENGTRMEMTEIYDESGCLISICGESGHGSAR